MFWGWNLTIDTVRDWWRKLVTPGGSQASVYGQGRAGMLARQYAVYSGQFTPALAPTKADPYGRDNVVENIMADIVDTGVAMLVAKGVTFELDTEDEAAKTFLDECWKRNKLDTKLHGFGMHGGIAGDIFVKVTRPDAQYGRVILLDPRCVDVVTDPDDCECVWEWKIKGERKDEATGKVILTQERTFRTVLDTEFGMESDPQSETLQEATIWQIVNEESYDSGKTWMTVGEPVIWNFSWAPIQHAQGNPNPSGFYGTPDLTPDLIAMNEALNFVTSTAKRNVRHYSVPMIYATGIPPNTPLTNEPGKINILPGAAGATGGAAQLKAVDIPTDIPNEINYARYLKESIYQRARVPDVSSRLQSLGQISGTALKVLYAPLIAKTMTKQQLCGDLLERVSTILLFLGGYGEHTVTAKFPDPTPVNDTEQASTALVYQQMGIVSKETLAKMFGLDYADEAPKIAAERMESDTIGSSLLDQYNRGEDVPRSSKASTGSKNTSDSDGSGVDDMVKKVNALGALIRAGFKPDAALKEVGLDPIKHSGLLPVTLKVD